MPDLDQMKQEEQGLKMAWGGLGDHRLRPLRIGLYIHGLLVSGSKDGRQNAPIGS
jgi:hypothetical protein